MRVVFKLFHLDCKASATSGDVHVAGVLCSPLHMSRESLGGKHRVSDNLLRMVMGDGTSVLANPSVASEEYLFCQRLTKRFSGLFEKF